MQASLRPDAVPDEVVDGFALVRLEADLSTLSPEEVAMLPLLAGAAERMEDLFWRQVTGRTKSQMLEAIEDPALRARVERNVGPWDRLDSYRPLLEDIGVRPPGVAFYPSDATAEEVEAAARIDPAIGGERTLVRRRDDGSLHAVPYAVAFAEPLHEAATFLRRAADLAPQDDLRRYLVARAAALETDEYAESDRAWLDMRDNRLDIVIPALETYEDGLLGAKAAYGAVILVKDVEWSARMAHLAPLMPSLQAALPVPAAYRREAPARPGDLGAYDALYLTGDERAPTPVAMNLPNNEAIVGERGSRRIQMRNLMRARYERIVRPIVEMRVVEDQAGEASFHAGFDLAMFHEIAHGLGPRTTVDGRSRVRAALGATNNTIEEAKSDTLGHWMLQRLAEQGDHAASPQRARFVTYTGELIRRLRGGSASPYAAGSAHQLRRLIASGGLVRETDGRLRIDVERYRETVEGLATELLLLQGDGDAARARAWAEAGTLDDGLSDDLARIDAAGIPVALYAENVVRPP